MQPITKTEQRQPRFLRTGPAILPATPPPARDRLPLRPKYKPVENLATIVHDTRNMVAALELYCDLLAAPGALAARYRHYAAELRLVAGASRQLMENLAMLDREADLPVAPYSVTGSALPILSIFPGVQDNALSVRRQELPTVEKRPSDPTGRFIENLTQSVFANQRLLSALAGPAITVDVAVGAGFEGDLPTGVMGRQAIAMTGNDLTRILVNLTRNAVEALPAGGRVGIALTKSPKSLTLIFADSGPGLSDAALESIFLTELPAHSGPHPGPSSKSAPEREGREARGPEAVSGFAAARPNGWPLRRRGLGLAIVHAIVSAAGGSVRAANGDSKSGYGGARFTLEFPLPPPIAPSAPQERSLDRPIERMSRDFGAPT